MRRLAPPRHGYLDTRVEPEQVRVGRNKDKLSNATALQIKKKFFTSRFNLLCSLFVPMAGREVGVMPRARRRCEKVQMGTNGDNKKFIGL